MRARGRRRAGPVEPARELAQLLDRASDLRHSLVEQPDCAVRAGTELVLRMAKRQPDRHQPLLRAVVEIALDPAALRIAGRDDPRARGLDLLELPAQLDPQPHDLDREPGRLHRILQQPRTLLVHRPVEHEPSGMPARVTGVRSRPSSALSLAARPRAST
jgi:hypothetical protein